MKFLDEEIILNFNNLPATSLDQSYTYQLYQNSSIAFAGSVFKRMADTSVSVNVTELLQSMHYQNDALELPLRDINTHIPEGVIDSVRGVLTINGSTYTSQNEDVAFVYRYPHYIYNLNQMIFYPHSYQYVALNNMLQGTNGSSDQKVLTPRIPWLGSDQYGFGSVYDMHNYVNPDIIFSGDLQGTVTLNCSNGTNIWYGKCDTMSSTATVIKDTYMLDPQDPYLVAGQQVVGNAQWDGDQSGYFINSNNMILNIATVNSNFYNLQTSMDLRSYAPGVYDIEYTFKGNRYFYAFAIGSTQNRVVIPVVAGKEEMFQDDVMRTFTVYFTLQVPDDKTQEPYKFENLKIMYNTTDTAAISLGQHKICDVDLRCSEDYYLQWIDRYGSFQSQPFKGSGKYTEKTESLEIQNYTGEHRKTYFSTQGSFQINSGFIKESVYPIYESIYTSPYLLLYDAKNNKSYNVVCSDTSYEEKTYKNNKALINLQLNLEINKTQSKIY